MKVTRERLEQKGWSDEEINHALVVLQKAKENAHPHIHLLNRVVYWFALVLIIIGNVAFSLMILPLLLTVENISLYFIVVILAFSFGTMMSIVIRDIEHIDKKHHIVFFSVVPVIGIVNFFIVVNVANNNFVANVLQVHHSPVLVALLYLFSFVTPYFFMVFKRKWMNSI